MARLVFLLLSLTALSACQAPVRQIVPALELGSREYLAIDLDLDGETDLIGPLEDAPNANPPGFTALALREPNGNSLDQINLPGRLVGLSRSSSLLSPDVLAFMVDGGYLHAYRIAKTIENGQSLDTTAHAVLMPAPVPDDEWDVTVTPSFIPLGSGNLLVQTSAGFSVRPRGVMELDRESLDVVDSWMSGAKLTGVFDVNEAANTFVVGTHSSNNLEGEQINGLSDDVGLLIIGDLDGFTATALPLGGRNAGVNIFPSSDSTYFVVVADTNPVSTRILNFHVDRPESMREIAASDSIHMVFPGNFSGGPEIDLLYSTLNGGLHVLDGRSEEVVASRRIGRGRLIHFRVLAGQERDRPLVATPTASYLLDEGLETLALGDPDVRILGTEPISSGGYIGLLEDDYAIIEVAADQAALAARRRLMLAALFLALALVASNLVGWWAGRRQSASLPRTDLYDYLVLGSTSEKTVVDQIVRVRQVLDEHAGEQTLSVARLASLSGFASTRELNDAVRRSTGHTARDLVEQYRLHSAARQLEATERTIDEIADAVGFRSHQYFTTRFKKAFGMTPSEYRGNGNGEE